MHVIQSQHYCDTWRSQPSGNFPSFRNVEAATSTFPLWMSQNFYLPVSLASTSTCLGPLGAPLRTYPVAILPLATVVWLPLYSASCHNMPAVIMSAGR
jgi:hypothetical protein